MTALAGLSRVTISAPRRRIDVALPAHLPVAELLPELLGLAGESPDGQPSSGRSPAGQSLADEGERHGGWVLRRHSGEPVSGAQSLHQQGIRDGAILHLVPAWAQWPELEYDDTVEAIADGARRTDRGWTPHATRIAALASAALPLGAGLLSIVGSARGVGGPQWTLALGVALLLLLAGITASRAYGDGLAGAALAGHAMPYAFVGGALVVSDGPSRLLVGCTALLLTGVLGAVGVASTRWLFVAGGTAGGLGVLGALLGFALPSAAAAALVLTVLTCGIGAVPRLAIRFGRLPVPPVAPAAGVGEESSADAGRELPGRGHVLDAVRRTSDILTGMLAGHAAVTAAASLVLVRAGGTSARLLVGAAGVALLLRSRVFAAARQRLPVLVAGLAALAVLLPDLAGLANANGILALVTAAVTVALAVVAGGAVYARRPASPYLARSADLLETALIVSMVPIACAVLDLYDRIRGLAG